MKALKHLAAACAVLVLLTSCSALTRTATKLASATTIGNSTGSALSSIFSVLKSAGVIDLSNLTNIINLGRILTGAGTLANANNAFTNDFASGLINGSSNLINSANGPWASFTNAAIFGDDVDGAFSSAQSDMQSINDSGQ